MCFADADQPAAASCGCCFVALANCCFLVACSANAEPWRTITRRRARRSSFDAPPFIETCSRKLDSSAAVIVRGFILPNGKETFAVFAASPIIVAISSGDMAPLHAFAR